MKVRIIWVCRPKSKRADYESEDIFIDKEVDFIPPIGSHIQVHPDGFLGEVEDIFIDLFKRDDDTPPVIIYLEEPNDDIDLRSWAEMKKQGWQIDSGMQGGA